MRSVYKRYAFKTTNEYFIILNSNHPGNFFFIEIFNKKLLFPMFDTVYTALSQLRLTANDSFL